MPVYEYRAVVRVEAPSESVALEAAQSIEDEHTVPYGLQLQDVRVNVALDGGPAVEVND